MKEEYSQPAVLPEFTHGASHRGKVWLRAAPNGRMWGCYREQWRKPNGDIDVSPWGVPNQSFTFHVSELEEVRYNDTDEEVFATDRKFTTHRVAVQFDGVTVSQAYLEATKPENTSDVVAMLRQIADALEAEV